jgi:hypothetical protein
LDDERAKAILTNCHHAMAKDGRFLVIEAAITHATAISSTSSWSGTIWAVLYAISMLSMAAMGYHVGLSGTMRPLAIPFLALVFAAVIQLIADLDRPFAGMITVDQRAMVGLRHSMDIIGAGPATVPPAKHSAR